MRFTPTWLRGYTRADLAHDAVAALVVTAIIVPEGMAYAKLAGLAPEAVFYTAPWALLAYALVGPSKRLIVATSGAAAALCGSIVADTGGAAPADVAAAIALISGVALIIAGVCRMGFIASFFSRPVLVGFVFGLAAMIAVKQAPKLLGLEAGDGDFFTRLWAIGSHLGDAHALTALIGLGALALLFGLEKLVPKVPAALLVVASAIVGSMVFGLEGRGVAVVGAVEGGIKPPRVPSLDLSILAQIALPALGVALVVFAEGVGNATGIATRHGERVHPNRELGGIGAASIAVGFLQGFPPGTSLSNSAANDQAGGRTPMSSVLAAGFIILVALVLTPLFAPLPEAVLAAIVVFAISGMFEVSAIARFFRLSKPEGVTALAALLGVLVFETLPGLAIGVVLSILLLAFRASRPQLEELGESDSGEYVSLKGDRGATRPEGVVVLRVGGGLWFANARQVCDEVDAKQRAGAKALVLDLEETPVVDVTTLECLKEVTAQQAARGTPLVLARVHRRVRALLERDEVLPAKGVSLAGSVRDAVESLQHA